MIRHKLKNIKPCVEAIQLACCCICNRRSSHGQLGKLIQSNSKQQFLIIFKGIKKKDNSYNYFLLHLVFKIRVTVYPKIKCSIKTFGRSYFKLTLSYIYMQKALKFYGQTTSKSINQISNTIKINRKLTTLLRKSILLCYTFIIYIKLKYHSMKNKRP